MWTEDWLIKTTRYYQNLENQFQDRNLLTFTEIRANVINCLTTIFDNSYKRPRTNFVYLLIAKNEPD